MNTADDDFRLAPGSPAVDQGADPLALGLPPGVVEADFLGDAARPQGAQFDIGAIEQGGAGGGCSPGELRPCYEGPAGTAGIGVCHAGTQTCLPGRVFGTCTGQVVPGTDIPNNAIDENCDGHDAECTPEASVSCYSGPAGTAGVGICQAGTQTCGADGLFGACAGEVLPATEIPDNGIDEDCDGAGQTDGPPLPPDPATVAPPLDRSVGTDLLTSSQFLYTGSNPIQAGVAPGAIDPKRVAVLRGLVMTRAGQPLPGVSVSVHQHPELGQTLSRA